MAASPLVLRDANGNEGEQTAKSKLMTVLAKHDDRDSSPQPEKEEGGDLAEQMNDQNRRKFIKGEFCDELSTHHDSNRM
jgi:hypothetical protein